MRNWGTGNSRGIESLKVKSVYELLVLSLEELEPFNVDDQPQT